MNAFAVIKKPMMVVVSNKRKGPRRRIRSRRTELENGSRHIPRLTDAINEENKSKLSIFILEGLRTCRPETGCLSCLLPPFYDVNLRQLPPIYIVSIPS